MRTRLAVLLAGLFFAPVFAASQEVQVNRNNKTIAVTADASVTADPDVAVITLAYQAFGATGKEAYDKNVQVSATIIQALLHAGVPKEAIETGALTVGPVPDDDKEKWTQEEREHQRYAAVQSWRIKAPAADAQKIVDLSMQAGANELREVEWDVSDRTALQAQAGAAALAKARTIAEQMAKGLGAQLGELVYASNKAPDDQRFVEQFWRRRYDKLFVGGAATPSLQLFPQRVKQSATVHAMFAIQ